MWDKFLAAGYIKPVDLALAKQLSGNHTLSPTFEAFLVHLSVAMRQGHVCIDSQMDIRPIWELIEQEETSQYPSDKDWEKLTQLIHEGMHTIPPHLSQTPNPSEPLNLKPIVIHGSKIYSQRCWLAESQFKDNLNAFLENSKKASFTISEGEIASKICQHGLESQLLQEQKEAILHSAAPLSLLAGGPGTGKTYTAGWMISILVELLQEKLGRPISVALTAPTGKAALHLENSVQKANTTTAKYAGVTLHSLLSKLPLQTDLIVVDEASMIDLEWMGKLLKELPTGARLILIGDPHQLPPVGMGSIFVDMIQTMPHTHLKQCLRTDLQEIVHYAHSIKTGVYTHWKQTFPLENEQALINHCVEHYSTFTTLQDFNQFKVLSPFTKGPFGTEQLNQKILAALKNPAVIPILITKNDYELELFNGEQGLWIPSRQIAQFPKKEGSGIREIPLSLIGAYQLGYCLTIHKSQGSEYAHVAIVYPEGAQIFGREALYTAVTRAKQSLEIYASPTVLQQTVQRNTRRVSGSASSLKQIIVGG